MPVPELATRLLGEREQGPLRNALGAALGFGLRVAGAHRERERLEWIHGMPIVVLPTVFNPRLLRTGAFFAALIAARRLGAQGEVLDLGTGSGVCALFAARHARRVVAVDINRAAVRCAAINAQINQLESLVECLHGDLFAPVRGQRFDAVFFNPPFILGNPADARDCAWRATDVAARFAEGLEFHLTPGGRAYLLLSTFGDACTLFVDELAQRGYALRALAARRYVNERITVLEVAAPGDT
jgi:HemK-related putative methylase